MKILTHGKKKENGIAIAYNIGEIKNRNLASFFISVGMVRACNVGRFIP
jgi:hypothetical protein